ncbi:hypothetical protein GCM10023189_30750 [Nibrella saemangeumensis]|uniref:DUF5615 domain-containing protein n=2 Tax=Nibrella saemangeumensis TaxID=1084526 RepID=A0ABP8MYX2_9BACT
MFPDCLHVSRTGLPIPIEDKQIWDWARANHYLIITNDEDFYHFAAQYSFPPKVVLLRMGNQSTRAIAEVLMKHLAEIDRLNDSNEYGLLEIF